MIKQDITLSFSGNGAFDFGSLSDQTQEAGLSNTTTAKEGDAVFTAASEGLELRTAASNGYIICAGIYCGPGRSWIFPAQGSGYYPLKIVLGSAALRSDEIEPSASGGVKLSVTQVSGTVRRFAMSNYALSINPSSGATATLKVERTGGGSGTLSFIVPNTDTVSNEISFSAGIASLDLGGTSSAPLGSIILRKHGGGADGLRPRIRMVANGAPVIKTGNAENETASLDAVIVPTFTSPATIQNLSIKGNGSGKLASISRTATSGIVYLSNSSTTDDFIINAATDVTEP
ncbi:MAG: hypothetical protein LBD55_11575 [Treponema sp.]|jgi:hypothetical protein|nr:hypothetical protein [Treponema sp.]